MKDKYFESEFCKHWVDENGITYEIFKSNFDRLDIEVVQCILSARNKTIVKLSTPLYVELGQMIRMDRRAFKLLWSSENLINVSAIGILVIDELERFAADVMINFTKGERKKSNVNMAYFTDKESAIFWLLKHRIDSLN